MIRVLDSSLVAANLLQQLKGAHIQDALQTFDVGMIGLVLERWKIRLEVNIIKFFLNSEEGIQLLDNILGNIFYSIAFAFIEMHLISTSIPKTTDNR